MAYESDAEPIKLGYLFDFVLPDGFPKEMRADLTQSFELVFEEGLAQGIIDRPIEIVFREVEGLPKGSVKAVIDAYGELVDEGCLAVFGPAITDNCVPTKEAIEKRFQVPAISVTGTDDWLGEWTFSLSMGSMTDEPVFWAHLLAKRNLDNVGRPRRTVARRRDVHQVLSSRLPRRRHPHRRRGADRPDGPGHRRCREEAAQRRRGSPRPLRFWLRCRADQPGSPRTCLGSSPVHGDSVPERLDQPNRLGARSSDGSVWTSTTRATRSGQQFIDRYAARYGWRPEYCVPVVNRDLATVLLHAFADAPSVVAPGREGGAGTDPLAPRGVRIPGNPDLLREMVPSGVDGCRLPGGPPVRP